MKIQEVVGEYIYKQRDREDVVTHRELATVIRKFKEKSPRYPIGLKIITQEELHRHVAKAREYLELEYKCTIWNLRGIGFRITSPDELAMYTARSVRRTIVMADRTIRLTDIVDRKRMPQALHTVFIDNEKRIKTLGIKGKKFMSTFINYIKQERKQIEENKKHAPEKTH